MGVLPPSSLDGSSVAPPPCEKRIIHSLITSICLRGDPSMRINLLTYTWTALLEIRSSITWRLPVLVCHRCNCLGHPAPFQKRRARRGCRAGQRLRRLIPVKQTQDSPHRMRQNTLQAKSVHQLRPTLVYPRIERCSTPPVQKLGFEFLSICSANNRECLDLLADYQMDILVLTLTWREDAGLSFRLSVRRSRCRFRSPAIQIGHL